MKCFYILFLSVFILIGCGGIRQEAYVVNSQGLLSIDGKHVLVKKKWFKVNPEQYPKFSFSEDIAPPEPYKTKYNLPLIKKTDVWEISYKVVDSYIAISSDYHSRLCEAPGYFWIDCARTRDYGIWIDINGNITGGWEVLKGNLKSGYEAIEDLSPKYKTSQNWPVKKLVKLKGNK